MPIPLPPQLSEGAPQDSAVSTPAAVSPAPTRRSSERRRLTAALIACFGSALLVGGAVNRALDPLAGGVCTGVTVDAAEADIAAAPPPVPSLGNPGAPAYLPPPHSFGGGAVCVLGGRAPRSPEDFELDRRIRETPRPPGARLGHIAKDFRPDPFVPLPR